MYEVLRSFKIKMFFLHFPKLYKNRIDFVVVSGSFHSLVAVWVGKLHINLLPILSLLVFCLSESGNPSCIFLIVFLRLGLHPVFFDMFQGLFGYNPTLVAA